MNALVIHDETSARLHWQICRTIAELPFTTPGTRARCLQLSDSYKGWADAIRSADNPGEPVIGSVTSSANIPTYDDLEHMVDWSQYDKQPCTWILQLLDLGMNPIAGEKVQAKTIWDFYQAVDRRYPHAPRGIIGWASYAHKGDAAAFKRADEKVIYQVTLE